MKKIIYGIVLLICLLTISVRAANYEFKELIPINTKTTLVSDNFSYKSFYYDGYGNVIFDSIKNISDKELPISATIAFFDKNKKNLGIMNFCSNDDMLKSKASKNYDITIDSSNVVKGKYIKDIKYIAILSDNINCNTGRSFDYVGKEVKDIGVAPINTLKEDETRTIKVLAVIGALLLLIFLYKFLFTKAYQNFDGDDVRVGYDKYNKRLKKEREEELKKNPPKPKEVKKEKSDKVIEQEKEAKNEDKSSTDLHNLYK